MKVEFESSGKYPLIKVRASNMPEVHKLAADSRFKTRYGMSFVFADEVGNREFLRSVGAEIPVAPFEVKRAGNYARPAFRMYSDPYDHQDEIFEATKWLQYYAVLWEMGLGKTKLALDIACFLYSENLIDALMIITLNGVHRNWITKEIPAHVAPEYEAVCDYWTAGRKDVPFKKHYAENRISFAAINVEALSTPSGQNFVQAYLRAKRTMCVVDESHGFKNPKAKRTKFLLKIRDLPIYRRIMTGTPIAGSPMDAFTQFYFLNPEIIGEPNFYSFQRKYAVLRDLPSNPRVKLICGYKNLEELKEKIAPYSSRKTKKECLDLPEKVYQPHSYEMSAEQKSLYKQFIKQFVAKLDSGQTVSVTIALTKLLRLRQIACGFVVPDDSEEMIDEEQEDNRTVNYQQLFAPDENPRINVVKNIIEQVEGKVIIWVTFTQSLLDIAAALIKIYGPDAVAVFYGAVKDDAREVIKARFQDENDSLRFMVCQTSCDGATTGVTFTQAQHNIYYNNSPSLLKRLQSEDRSHRIGQTKTVFYHDIIALDSIDSKLVDCLVGKLDIAAKITGDEIINWIKMEK